MTGRYLLKVDGCLAPDPSNTGVVNILDNKGDIIANVDLESLSYTGDASCSATVTSQIFNAANNSTNCDMASNHINSHFKTLNATSAINNSGDCLVSITGTFNSTDVTALPVKSFKAAKVGTACESAFSSFSDNITTSEVITPTATVSECSAVISNFIQPINTKPLCETISIANRAGEIAIGNFVEGACKLDVTGGGSTDDALSCNSAIRALTDGKYNITDMTYSNGQTLGLEFVCGTKTIQYNYNGFDAEFVNSCTNPCLSYIVLTPNTTGDLILGADECNVGFPIMDVEKQSGDFYLTPMCGSSCNGNDVVQTFLNNAVITNCL